MDTVSYALSKKYSNQIIGTGIKSGIFVDPNIFRFTLDDNSIVNISVSNFNNYTLTEKNKLALLDSNILSKFAYVSGQLLFDGNPISGGSIDLTSYLKTVDADARYEFKNSCSYIVGIGGVLQYKVGYISNSDTIMTASSNDLTHFNKVIGIILETKNQGESVKVQTGREVVNNTWNLVVGDSYYLGIGGNITNIAPITGFIQKIGMAKNSTTLSINLGTPIKLI